ncbi:pimeloyl-ACP methyl ester esterase BioH [Vibrio salinus]|uniref:pimeloyl-ACP methyl ester esterase BioH n=1 Tax=Vibrio salinus TaxID=2899784 RepID=UPI001E398741|nr:pimeloyl-ACP methyl ester esterase BioH [Vibrio salinus]MCE0493868.1 pimeloyl-ACP methyl ester esterase BioH [Vibrio salinus]
MGEKIYWQVEGEGDDIVFLHGWGMNGAVWANTLDALKARYRVHIVDLPGYGFSADSPALSLDDIVDRLLLQAPEKAVWLGWSLGGLVASLVALRFPGYVSKLVTVASSPKFAASSPWRGIQPQVLADFTTQLVDNFQLTIERFMALQAMGSPTARQDVKLLKKTVLSRPQPNPDALLAGLAMLENVDLREEMTTLTVPMLRMYGRLDGLVPVKVAKTLDKCWPQTESVIFSQSSHAPFITEPEAFVQELTSFIGK